MKIDKKTSACRPPFRLVLCTLAMVHPVPPLVNPGSATDWVVKFSRTVVHLSMYSVTPHFITKT